MTIYWAKWILIDKELSELIRVTFNYDGVELVGFNEIRDFSNPQEYKITAPDGTVIPRLS